VKFGFVCCVVVVFFFLDALGRGFMKCGCEVLVVSKLVDAWSVGWSGELSWI
jgi:hypothetical protein